MSDTTKTAAWLRKLATMDEDKAPQVTSPYRIAAHTIEQQQREMARLTRKVELIKHKVEIDATKEVVLSIIVNKEQQQGAATMRAFKLTDLGAQHLADVLERQPITDLGTELLELAHELRSDYVGDAIREGATHIDGLGHCWRRVGPTHQVYKEGLGWTNSRPTTALSKL